MEINYKDLHKKFIEALEIRYPGGYNYNRYIGELLGLDKNAISRRMRGITQFTIEEVAKICVQLDISVDSWINVNQNHKHPMQLYFHKFGKTLERKVKEVGLNTETIKFAVESEQSEIILSSNSIPINLFCMYPYVCHFYFFIWYYHYYKKGIDAAFQGFQFDPELYLEVKGYVDCVKKFRKSVIILTDDMMRYIVKNILYFKDIKVLNKEEVQKLYDELNIFLTDMETVATKGYWDHPENSVHIYISHMPVPNETYLLDTTNLKFGIIFAFLLNPIVTQTYETFCQLKTWQESLIRVSEQISISGEKARYKFFEMQRKLLQEIL